MPFIFLKIYVIIKEKGGIRMFDRKIFGFDPGYFLFMNEQEEIRTRTEKINDIKKDFKYLVSIGKNPNDYIYEILHKNGLNEDLLTDDEIYEINHCI